MYWKFYNFHTQHITLLNRKYSKFRENSENVLIQGQEKTRFFPRFFDDLGHFEPIKQRTFWENCEKNSSHTWAGNFIQKKKAPSKLWDTLYINVVLWCYFVFYRLTMREYFKNRSSTDITSFSYVCRMTGHGCVRGQWSSWRQRWCTTGRNHTWGDGRWRGRRCTAGKIGWIAHCWILGRRNVRWSSAWGDTWRWKSRECTWWKCGTA